MFKRFVYVFMGFVVLSIIGHAYGVDMNQYMVQNIMYFVVGGYAFTMSRYVKFGPKK